MVTRNLPLGPSVIVADFVRCPVPPSRSATLSVTAQPVTSAGGTSWKSSVRSSPRTNARAWLIDWRAPASKLRACVAMATARWRVLVSRAQHRHLARVLRVRLDGAQGRVVTADLDRVGGALAPGALGGVRPGLDGVVGRQGGAVRVVGSPGALPSGDDGGRVHGGPPGCLAATRSLRSGARRLAPRRAPLPRRG